MGLKKYLKFRVLLLLFFIIISLVAMNPKFSADLSGIRFDSSLQPTQREIIKQINGQNINNIEDYSKIVNSVNDSSVLRILTNKQEYILLKQGDLGISVDNLASSNIRRGLDLQGGTRVVLEPEEKLADAEINDLISTMENRLNVYGLSDLKIRSSNDLSGNTFVVVEIAGASKEEVRELIASQGKFEAKIEEEVVFIGGKKDVTFVCREDGTCSGIRQCSEFEEGYQCTFEFQIKLSQEAAKKHAEVTSKLDANLSATGGYLSKPLDLYLDGILVDSL